MPKYPKKILKYPKVQNELERTLGYFRNFRGLLANYHNFYTFFLTNSSNFHSNSLNLAVTTAQVNVG